MSSASVPDFLSLGNSPPMPYVLIKVKMAKSGKDGEEFFHFFDRSDGKGADGRDF